MDSDKSDLTVIESVNELLIKYSKIYGSRMTIN